MNFIVINADVKDSRIGSFKKADFEERLELLNNEFAQDILVPFSIIKGDELQGVLHENANVFKFIRLIRGTMLPFTLRIGVGVGAIYEEDTIKNVVSSWVLNGPAFFNAREAMDSMKNVKGKKSITFYTCFKTQNENLDMRLNILYSYVDDILLSWTEEMYDIAYYEEKGFKHEDIALFILKKGGSLINSDVVTKARVNVTKRLLRNKWYKVKYTEEVLHKLFRED